MAASEHGQAEDDQDSTDDYCHPRHGADEGAKPKGHQEAGHRENAGEASADYQPDP